MEKKLKIKILYKVHKKLNPPKIISINYLCCYIGYEAYKLFAQYKIIF